MLRAIKTKEIFRIVLGLFTFVLCVLIGLFVVCAYLLVDNFFVIFVR